MSIKYKKGYKYQLVEDAGFFLQCDNVELPPYIETDWIRLSKTPPSAIAFLEVKNGYAWDGCSGPTWDTPSTMRASLVHDALYELIRKGLLKPEHREWADNTFLHYMNKDKVWKVRANLYYKAVRKWARSATLASHKRKIYEAP